MMSSSPTTVSGCFALLFVFLLVDVTPRVRSLEPPSMPQTFVWNGDRLTDSWKRVQSKDPDVMPAYEALVRAANRLVTAKTENWTVMAKNFTPPSGSKHDFESVATYYWPCNSPRFQPAPSNCNKTSGLPWVAHDGIANTEAIDQLDSFPNSKMTAGVMTLSLAYYFTQNETFAEKAVALINQWYLNPDTSMNPNLEYGQYKPGINNGSSGGIITTYGWVELIDGVQLLTASRLFPPSLQSTLTEWFNEYSAWLVNSQHGKIESNARNNHATWYDDQVSVFSLFGGNLTTAQSVASHAAAKRINTQIQPDGEMPFEENRTLSASYCFFNLRAILNLADLSLHSRVNLYNYTSSDGRSLRKAIDFMIPFATGVKPWPFKQIHPFRWSNFFQIFRRAFYAYGDRKYENAIEKLPEPETDGIDILLFPNVESWKIHEKTVDKKKAENHSPGPSSYVNIDGVSLPVSFITHLL